MLIGVDASRATQARRTGTERYSLELIRHLLALYGRHRWLLYCQSAPRPGLFVIGEHVTCRVIPLPRLWTHIGLSWEMLTRPPDVLLVPAHVLPAWRPQRSVVTVHDLGYRHHPESHPWRQRTYLEWSTRWNARVATRILVDSQATKDDLVAACGVNPTKITVVYPGRDESLSRVDDPEAQAAVRARYGIGPHYILYVGTLQPRKNLVRLIQAFARLIGQAEGIPADLELVLAGQPGWLSDAILAEPDRLGITTRVRFPGYMADVDLAALLSGALAFAYPSLYEGFGFPVLEAQTCGVPVLTSSISSLPEVAGDAAWLVDPTSVDAIADGLCRLLTDESLRASLIARGYANVRRFSWGRAAREVLDVLEQVGGSDHQPHTTRITHHAPRTTATRILGVRIDPVTTEEALARLAAFVSKGTPHHVVTINPEFVMASRRYPAFRAVLEAADLCLADGIGLLWAGRILGRPLPERVAGSDLLPRIAVRAAQEGWRLFFLGAQPGVAQQAAGVLQARHAGLQVVGTYPGSPGDEESSEIIGRVRAARPDMLFVAYGAPAQDLWIARHRDALAVPVMMGVGGAFDFIAGVTPRAPMWIRRVGLEWLHRLIHQPWRWRRMLALPHFALRVVAERFIGERAW